MRIDITTYLDQVITWEDGEYMDYAQQNTYCYKFIPGGTIPRIIPVYAPGEDGGGTQNFGKRESDHEVHLVYVGANEIDCLSGFAVDMAQLADGVFSMILSDLTFAQWPYEGCFLNEKPKAEQPKRTERNGTYRMDATLKITSARPD